MPAKLESSKGLERKLKITIPAEEIEKEFAIRLKKIQPTVKLKGFRDGKVPEHIVKQQYGNSVREEVISQMINTNLQEAVKQEKLHVAGRPTIEPSKIEEGQPLEFTAVFEVFPKVELKSFEGVAFENPVCEVSDDDIVRVIDRIQMQHAEWNSTDQKSKDGDRITVDVDATLDKETYEAAGGQDLLLTVGNSQVLPEINKKIDGVAVADEFSVKQKIPKDAPQEDMAGKTLVQNFKVKQIETPTPHPLDAAFLEKLGMKEGGMDALRTSIRHSMEHELKDSLSALRKRSIMDKFIEMNKVEVPQGLVRDEMTHLRDTAVERFKASHNQQEIPEVPAEQFEDQAMRRIQLGLLISEYVKQHEIKADRERVQKMIAQQAARYDDPQKVIQWYMEDKNRLAEIESAVLEEQVVEKALEQFKVKEKSMSFEDVMTEASNQR